MWIQDRLLEIDSDLTKETFCLTKLYLFKAHIRNVRFMVK